MLKISWSYIDRIIYTEFYDYQKSFYSNDSEFQWQIKKAILSAESSVKEFIFGSKKEPREESQTAKLSSDNSKEHP